jgi:hypothetical protein
MFKTNSPGSTVDGHFTEGNPSTGVPATVVGGPWLNAVQDELTNAIEAAGLTLSSGDSTQLLQALLTFAGAVPSTRNLLINGDMRVAQRTKFKTFGLAVGTLLTGLVIDRWNLGADTGSGTGMCTVSRQAFAVGQTAVPGGPQYFLQHIQSPAASAGQPVVSQKVEGVRGFNSGQVTLSVWLMGATAFSVGARVVQNFGTGGSPSSPVVCGTGTFAVTTGWQKFTLTVTRPTIGGKTIGTADNDHLLVELQLPQGTTFTLNVARAQLERGSVSSDFEVRPLTQEIAYCRRYFEKSYEVETDPASATNLGANRWSIDGNTPIVSHQDAQERFLVSKRAVPTTTWYDVLGNAGTITMNGSAGTSVTSTADISRCTTGVPSTGSSGGATGVYAAHWTADAEL